MEYFAYSIAGIINIMHSPPRYMLLLILLLCPIPAKSADSAENPHKPVILLTGFEPFGGAAINESWETVKQFQGKDISGYHVETALLPVVYDDMAKPLEEAIARHKPEVVISFGVGSSVIQVEILAHNGYNPAKPLDNKGNAPPRLEIAPHAAAQLFTSLPTPAILAALSAEKIAARASNDAGGYLCNECFYRLMLLPGPSVRGFVHVPPFGTKDPNGGVFDAERLTRAIRIVVETTLHAKQVSPGK